MSLKDKFMVIYTFVKKKRPYEALWSKLGRTTHLFVMTDFYSNNWMVVSVFFYQQFIICYKASQKFGVSFSILKQISRYDHLKFFFCSEVGNSEGNFATIRLIPKSLKGMLWHDPSELPISAQIPLHEIEYLLNCFSIFAGWSSS